MRSMTGYGHYAYRSESVIIDTEIKSVNNRYLDISKYLSPALQPFESYIDSEIKKVAKRGHIDISMKLKVLKSEPVLTIDSGLLGQYRKIYEEIGRITGQQPSFSDYASIEGLIASDKTMDDDTLRPGVEESLSACLSMLDHSKSREGEGTREDLERLGHEFEASLDAIRSRSGELEAHYHDLLVSKYNELMESKPDQAVFMTELGAILVRYSINEEISRLSVHLSEYWKLLASGESVGKRLDFLSQEMQRECNTIASKSQLVDINLAVVRMKDNIEDIREQVRNIE